MEAEVAGREASETGGDRGVGSGGGGGGGPLGVAGSAEMAGNAAAWTRFSRRGVAGGCRGDAMRRTTPAATV